MVQDIADDANIPTKDNLIGPSVSGTWTPEQVWDAGYLSDYSSDLCAIAVEQYVFV